MLGEIIDKYFKGRECRLHRGFTTTSLRPDKDH